MEKLQKVNEYKPITVEELKEYLNEIYSQKYPSSRECKLYVFCNTEEDLIEVSRKLDETVKDELKKNNFFENGETENNI